MTSPRPRVLVTGGTRGLGRAICDALAPDHELLVGGRAADAVRQACARYEHAQPFVADLADEEQTRTAADAIDRLDAVVHSAGVLGNGTLTDLRREDWRRCFEVNVIAVADLTRLLLPRLAESRGTVVVLNSGSGLTAHGPGGVYSASKFAVRAFTDALRTEVAPDGIRVVSIHPGRADTDMQHELRAFERGDYDAGDYLRPESVARTVRVALTMPRDACVESLSVRPAPRG